MPYCSVMPTGYNPQNLQCLGCQAVDCVVIASDLVQLQRITDISLLSSYLVSEYIAVRESAYVVYEKLQLYKEISDELICES